MGNLFRRRQLEIKKQLPEGETQQKGGKFIFDIHQMVKIKNLSIRNQYVIITPSLGKGAYGQVFKAHHKYTDRLIRSIKMVYYKGNPALLKEYEILRELDHPNILKLYEIYIEPQHYSLVTDYYEGGCLRDKIKSSQKIHQFWAATYMQQILTALSYMHGKGFMHCDLKPDNILLDKSHNLVKLIDFGVSRKINQTKCKQRGVGTQQYIAPEIVHGIILPKSDIWSCGVTLIFMLTGQIPSFRKLHAGTYQLDVDMSSLLSNEVKDLIFRMLSVDPCKRPTAQDALKHPWFLEHHRQRSLDVNAIERCLSNMKKYLLSNRLQCLFMSMIANFVLSQQDLIKPIQVFLYCDQDNDGVISISELKSIIANFCPKSYKCLNIDSVFEELDKNESQSIDLRQFLACSVDSDLIFQKKHIQQVFMEIDTNKDNRVSIEEFQIYVDMAVPETKIKQELFHKLDINQDGYINLSEFTEALKNQGT